MNKDLRVNILRHFDNLDNSTSETKANPWLSKQHTDLGTIRRSLIDLIKSDFIRLSSIGDIDPIKWLETKWDTTTHGEQTADGNDKKSSKRLVQKVGQYEKVEDVRMYTTVKGLMFINEYRRFRYHYFYLFAFSLLSFALGLVANQVTKTPIREKHNFEKREMSKPKSILDTIVHKKSK